MANKILIIGVGSAGVIAADKMNLPNSNKLFINTNFRTLNDVKPEGDKIEMVCKERENCPMLYCHCFDRTGFCREVVGDYEDEIRDCIMNAFGE